MFPHTVSWLLNLLIFSFIMQKNPYAVQCTQDISTEVNNLLFLSFLLAYSIED